METTVWTKHEDGSFAAEASMMNASGQRVCPGCKAGFTIWSSKLRTFKNGEGEVTLWQGSCPCGAALTIFND